MALELLLRCPGCEDIEFVANDARDLRKLQQGLIVTSGLSAIGTSSATSSPSNSVPVSPVDGSGYTGFYGDEALLKLLK